MGKRALCSLNDWVCACQQCFNAVCIPLCAWICYTVLFWPHVNRDGVRWAVLHRLLLWNLHRTDRGANCPNLASGSCGFCWHFMVMSVVNVETPTPCLPWLLIFSLVSSVPIVLQPPPSRSSLFLMSPNVCHTCFPLLRTKVLNVLGLFILLYYYCRVRLVSLPFLIFASVDLLLYNIIDIMRFVWFITVHSIWGKFVVLGPLNPLFLPGAVQCVQFSNARIPHLASGLLCDCEFAKKHKGLETTHWEKTSQVS